MAVTITPDVTSISRDTIISVSSDAGALSAIFDISWTFNPSGLLAWISSGGFSAGYTGTEDGPKQNVTISRVEGWRNPSITILNSSPVATRVYDVVHIVDLNVLSKTLIRVVLSDEIVVDEAYLTPSNYTLTTPTGVGPEVVGVLPSNSPVSSEIILRTNTMTEGTTYTLNFSGLSLRNGLGLSIVGDFISRVTKLDSILKSIPKHFDKRSTSKLHAALTAVSISDDLIGGYRSDSITYG